MTTTKYFRIATTPEISADKDAQRLFCLFGCELFFTSCYLPADMLKSINQNRYICAGKE